MIRNSSSSPTRMAEADYQEWREQRDWTARSMRHWIEARRLGFDEVRGKATPSLILILTLRDQHCLFFTMTAVWKHSKQLSRTAGGHFDGRIQGLFTRA
jgi:hypothetical protein